MCKNKEYLFVNLFDTILYIGITTIYPFITYLVQIPKISNDSIYEMLITGLFFTGTFFYDFYSKYEGNDGKYACILNFLLIGEIIFGVFSFFIFIVIIIFSFNEQFANQILIVFHFIPVLVAYPFLMSVIELIKRISRKHKGKLSRVNV